MKSISKACAQKIKIMVCGYLALLTIINLINLTNIDIVKAQYLGARSPYTGLKLPFEKDKKVTVTGDSSTHKTNNGYERHALDFSVMNVNVLAMRGGKVVKYYEDKTGGGWTILIDHLDGYYSAYLHLNDSETRKIITPLLNTTIKQGTLIAVSGNSGNNVYHLHVEVNKKDGNSLNHGANTEVPMYFDEYPNIELKKGDVVKSGNSVVLTTPVSAKTILPLKFVNGVSTVWFDNNFDRLNVKVCATNLKGNTVYLRVDRTGKSWEYNVKATGNCVTFYDVEGKGAVLRNVVYTTRIALNQKPDVTWTTPCAKATDYQGLCDKISRK